MEVGTNGRQTAAASATRQQRQLEINAPTVLFPIAVARRVQPFAATNLARRWRRHGGFRCGSLVRRLRWLGSWLRLTYHDGLILHRTKGSTTGHVYQANDRTLRDVRLRAGWAQTESPTRKTSPIIVPQDHPQRPRRRPDPAELVCGCRDPSLYVLNASPSGASAAANLSLPIHRTPDHTMVRNRLQQNFRRSAFPAGPVVHSPKSLHARRRRDRRNASSWRFPERGIRHFALPAE